MEHRRRVTGGGIPRQSGGEVEAGGWAASGSVRQTHVGRVESRTAPSKASRTGDPKYNLVIMNQSSIGAPNTSAIMLHLELEHRGHTVSTVHWEHGTDLRETPGGDFLESQKCEVKISDLPGVSDNEHFMAMVKDRLALQKAEKDAQIYVKRGIEIQDREDGLYVVYPKVVEDIRKIDGINTMSDRPEKSFGMMEQALVWQKKIEDAGAVPMTSVEATRVSMDKEMSQRRFNDAGVPQPDYFSLTRHAPFDEESVRAGIEAVGLPVMVKGGLGSGGSTVFPIDTVEEALAKVKELLESGNSIVVQKRIEPLERDGGRAHVNTFLMFNGEIVQATRWIASPDGELTVPMVEGRFTAGAQAIPIEPTETQREICRRTVIACGQEKGLASIDAMDEKNDERAARGGVKTGEDNLIMNVIESNSMPGMASAMQAGDVPVVSKIAEGYIEMIGAVKDQQKPLPGRSCP